MVSPIRVHVLMQVSIPSEIPGECGASRGMMKPPTGNCSGGQMDSSPSPTYSVSRNHTVPSNPLARITSIWACVSSSFDQGTAMRMIFVEFHRRAMCSSLRKM